MIHKYLILALFAVSTLSGCRYFRSEATIHIQALNGDGEALMHAKVVIDKVSVGTTDEHGELKTHLDLPVDEPLLVEVSKASSDTFFAPFFETIKVKRGDLNTFKIKAILYGVKNNVDPVATADSVVADSIADTAGAAGVDTAAATLEVSPDPLGAPMLSTATDAHDAAMSSIAPENGRPLTFYVVAGRDAIDNASVYFGDPAKRQWMHGCYSNTNGRCSFQIPEHMDSVVILVRAKGFQTQSRSFQLFDGDKVRFEMTRGKSLEIFAISPSRGAMEGVEGVQVSLGGKALGKTDRFGSFIQPLATEMDLAGKVTLEADQWLPSKAEFTLSASSDDSIIQHFQNIKPSAPKFAVMDFITYRDKSDAPMLSAPSLEALQAALASAGGLVINGPSLNGKLAAQKISLNDLTAANWNQLKKIDEPIHYIIRPSFIEGNQARIILSAIDPLGRMVYSASQSVKAKGSNQAVLAELSARLLQNLKQEGAIVEAVGEEFRINLGKAHGVALGDKIQITGNVRLPTGEITAWDMIASATVTEAGAERSRIKLITSQPNTKVEAGNSVAVDRKAQAASDSIAVQVQEEQTLGPISQAEVYAGDQWLGATEETGFTSISAVDVLKTKDIQVFSPGYTPKTVTIAPGTPVTVALAHEATAIQIESQPAGALVKINGRDLGRTPIDTDIPYPGATVKVEIGGVDGFEYITRSQAVSSRGIILRGATQITLNRDPQQAARALAAEGKLPEACQLLESIPETDGSYLLAQHQLGELYLNQLHDPVKAASAFHKVTSDTKVDSFKDKRFIGTYINEAVALFQAGELVMSSDNNLAISYWRQSAAILTQTEDQLRFVPQAQYNQAVHTLSYYRALSLHKTWNLTQNADDQALALQHWKDYIQGTALALPQDQHYDWVKKAEGYFEQIRTASARNKTRTTGNRSPVAL